MTISPVSFDLLHRRGHIDLARRAGVTVREDDQIFGVEGAVAFGCVRMISPWHARLCGCFVAPEHRGRGYGRALVLHRLRLRQIRSFRLIDTFAFHSGLFMALGFTPARSFKIGTTLLRLEQPAHHLPLVVPRGRAAALARIGDSTEASVFCGSQAEVDFITDMIAVDPPWRQGNLSYWSSKAGTSQRWDEFAASMERHFCATLVYLKVGVPELPMWANRLASSGMREIIRWETSYCAGRNAQIVASRGPSLSDCPREPESRRASTAIAAWASAQGMRTVADPCVGLGKMLDKFRRRGMLVAGVELNEARAAEAARRLCSLQPLAREAQ